MKSNEICEFELVISNKMIECQVKFVIPYENEIKSNDLCEIKMPKIISK